MAQQTSKKELRPTAIIMLARERTITDPIAHAILVNAWKYLFDPDHYAVFGSQGSTDKVFEPLGWTEVTA